MTLHTDLSVIIAGASHGGTGAPGGYINSDAPPSSAN